MADDIKLTPTSYIVLGLLELCGKATPYELKGMVAGSLGNFWSVPHAQLYTETERLAKAGILAEEREEGGRRRKTYSLTAVGRRALVTWRAESTAELYELRDMGLLKLFFGADPAQLAAQQLVAHEARLESYKALLEALSLGDPPEGPRLTLEAGIGHEREYVRFWKRLAE
jgi:PadR family transcriptional regulator, regulatory protein AphA